MSQDNDDTNFEKLARSDFGIIGRFYNAPPFFDEPKFINLTSFLLENGKEEVSSESQNLGRAGGASLDRHRAFTKMFGESIERFALIDPATEPPKLISYQDLNSSTLCLDPNLIHAGKEAISPNRHNLKFAWIKATHVNSNNLTQVPKQLVDLPYINPPDEPLIRVSISTGAACGKSLEDATERAFLETVERDGFMLSWLTNTGLSRLIINDSIRMDSTLLGRSIREVERYRLSPKFYLMDSYGNIPNILCVLFDHQKNGVTFSVGAKASLNPENAVLGSLEEAVQLRHWLRTIKNNYDKSSNLNTPNTIYDRGLMTQSEKYLLILNEWLEKAITGRDIEMKALFRDAFQIEYPEDLFIVDLTERLPISITKHGFCVVKAIVPSFQPLYLTEDLPDYATDRISKRIQNGPINLAPHPFL